MRLIGKALDSSEPLATVKDDRPSAGYQEMKTGETVYVMDMPVLVNTLSPSRFLLRIALHTFHTQAALRHAQIHSLTAAGVVSFLWILALAYLRYAKRIDDLQRKEMEKKHFTILGEMAAVLAHEIRSPLSAIKGFAQYILEKTEGNSRAEEDLDVIISESQKLEHLTEDLLLYISE